MKSDEKNNFDKKIVSESSFGKSEHKKQGHPLFEVEDDYFYCIHCEKVYPEQYWEKNNWFCPNDNCKASPIDCWPWDFENESGFVRVNGYPKKPEIGKHYPMYPK